jgi:hypothetical protein
MKIAGGFSIKGGKTLPSPPAIEKKEKNPL